MIKIIEGFDVERASALLKEERENGFIYIDSVCAGIEGYLQNRHNYDGFNDFIPELIRLLIAEYA